MIRSGVNEVKSARVNPKRKCPLSVAKKTTLDARMRKNDRRKRQGGLTKEGNRTASHRHRYFIAES